MPYKVKRADPYQTAANRVTRLITETMPIMQRQVAQMTVLSNTELAAAVYAILLPLLSNDRDLTAKFIDATMVQNPTLYETIFRHLFNLGYAAAINDITHKRIKITR